MARPERKDVDYFPFYVKDGKTLFILEDKYGCMGTGFFTNMLRFLCQTPDHHFCIEDDADRLFFFSKMKCDEELGAIMLDLMAKTGKIYAPLWVSSRVIVSPDLLDSIKDAYRNRKTSIITLKEIIALYTKKVVSDTRNTNTGEFPTPETTPETSLNGITDVSNPQSKVKESKVNNIYAFSLEDFENVWKKYPARNGKVVGKSECLKYLKALKFTDWEFLLKAVDNYSKCETVREGYAKDPIRFLKKDYWRDWLEPEKPKKESIFDD